MRAWGVLLGVVLWASAAVAAPLPSAHDVLQRLGQRNQGLQTCHCRVRVQLQMSLLPVVLSGDIYYQHPDKVKVTFDDIPPMLRLRQGLFTDLMPKSRRADQYTAVVEGEETLDGQPSWKVVVKPKAPGDNVLEGRLWVVERDLTVPKLVLRYKNGSKVEMDGLYESIKQYSVPARLTFHIHLPHLSTQADVDYDGYEFNHKLPPGTFTRRTVSNTD